MRFFLDQDVYAITERFLTSLGHDVVPAAQVGYSRADDWELLQLAQEQGRILITRDRDFGGFVFVRGMQSGVLYLRSCPRLRTRSTRSSPACSFLILRRN